MMWSLEDQELPEPHPATPDALLLTVEEAAAKLGVQRTTMFKLMRSGEVRSVHVGRLRRVPVACLDEYVAHLLAEEPQAAS